MASTVTQAVRVLSSVSSVHHRFSLARMSRDLRVLLYEISPAKNNWSKTDQILIKHDVPVVIEDSPARLPVESQVRVADHLRVREITAVILSTPIIQIEYERQNGSLFRSSSWYEVEINITVTSVVDTTIFDPIGKDNAQTQDRGQDDEFLHLFSRVYGGSCRSIAAENESAFICLRTCFLWKLPWWNALTSKPIEWMSDWTIMMYTH